MGTSQPDGLRASALIEVQRSTGNQAVVQLLQRGDPQVQREAAAAPPAWAPPPTAIRSPRVIAAGPEAADPGFNPESIVHDLRRAIDQSEVDVVTLARKVDAATVIRVLDNLTPSQIATVKRLYAEQEKRPDAQPEGSLLEHDLFGTGESGCRSSLQGDQRERIRALLSGTRAETGGPGAPAAEGRLEADAIELHELLSGDLDEVKRERIMALHRRPVGEITSIDHHYAARYGTDLSFALGDALKGLQRNRMAELRSGNWALADACAIEDKRRALEGLASSPIDPFHPEAREEERKRLSAGIDAIIEQNQREALADPANLGKFSAQALHDRLAPILSTPTAEQGQSLGDALVKTLGPGKGGAIAATMAGRSVVELAAQRLADMEANHTTKTEKIAELLHELRTQARHDVLARVQDPWAADSEKQAIATNPEAAVDAQAKSYTLAFKQTYDYLRGDGRTYDDILASAKDYNEDMLKALTAGGGELSWVDELDHAIRSKDAEAIKAALRREPTQRDIDEKVRNVRDLVRKYEERRGEGSLRKALYGLFGDADQAMFNPIMRTGLLTGHDAALAEEALEKPEQLGGAAEVDWIARHGQLELEVTEAGKGTIGRLRDITGDPETEALMKESTAKLVELQDEWQRSDPWGEGRPRQQILAEMRRVRATLTGDATAYEEENARIVAEIRSAVSFAVQIALAVALPGIGEGFLATTALNIGATVASNMVIYGDEYNLERLWTDVKGGVLGAAGGKFGEEFLGAVAEQVAGRTAASAAGAAERAGLSTALAKEGEEAAALAGRGSLAVKAVREAGSLLGGAGGTTVATGESGFTPEALAQAGFLSLLGKAAAAKRSEGGGPRETSAEQAPGVRTGEPTGAGGERGEPQRPSEPVAKPEPQSVPGAAPPELVELAATLWSRLGMEARVQGGEGRSAEPEVGEVPAGDASTLPAEGVEQSGRVARDPADVAAVSQTPKPAAASGAPGRGSYHAPNHEEMLQMFTRAFRRPGPGEEAFVVHREPEDFARAWTEAWAAHNPGSREPVPPTPRGFFDPIRGQIHVPADAETLTVIHEALHWTGNQSGTVRIMGAFWEEGMVEVLTRREFGPRGYRHAYDQNVALIKLMSNVVGQHTLEGAFLHGNWEPLIRALESRLGGQPQVEEFLKHLQSVGDVGANGEHLGAAMDMLWPASAEPESGRPEPAAAGAQPPSRMPPALGGRGGAPPDTAAAYNEVIDHFLVHGPPKGRPSAEEVASATAALNAGQLAPGVPEVLLRHAVADARAYVQAFEFQRQEPKGGYLDYRVLKDACGMGRDVSTASLGVAAQNSPQPITIRRFQAADIFDIVRSVRDPETGGMRPISPAHAFSVVIFPGGKSYLVDATFGQFMRPRGASPSPDATAEVLRRTSAGRALAADLLRDGFVPLTEDTAALYAEAMGADPAHAHRLGQRLMADQQARLVETVGRGQATAWETDADLGIDARSDLVTIILRDYVPKLEQTGAHDDAQMLRDLAERLRLAPTNGARP